MASPQEEIQKKARNELIQHAFFRWESALIIAITIVLTFLLPQALWLVAHVGVDIAWAYWAGGHGLYQPN